MPIDEREIASTRQHLTAFADRSWAKLPDDFVECHSRAEVTIVILSHHRIDDTRRAVDAIRRHVRIPYHLLLIDNGSDPATQAALRELRADDPSCQLVLLRENVGCGPGRNLAVEHVATEYVLFLDNDLEVMPGTVESLLHQFDVDPNTNAVTGRVVLTDGNIQLCGAGFRVEDGVRLVEYFASGERFDTPLAATGDCDWVPGCLALIRTALLQEFPFDPDLRYFEDNEWALRVSRAGVSGFRWVSYAVALHNHQSRFTASQPPERPTTLMPYVADLARLTRLDGHVYGELFNLLPELGSPTNPSAVLSARLFLDLTVELGLTRLLQLWLDGRLDALFTPNEHTPADPRHQQHEPPTALETQLAEERVRIAALLEITDLLEHQLARSVKAARNLT
jgi:GT2 family glycosyltransferase